MSVRFRICLMAWIAVLALTLLNKHASAQTQELTPVPEEVLPAPVNAQPLPPVESEWVVNIQPSQKTTNAPTFLSGECEGCDAKPNAADYARIYKSIPFNRAEYNVNPSYRHDATMEILTGNARHTTIVRHDSAIRPVASRPAAVAVQPLNPSRYGYLRPALRLNYYKNFPSLNPYVNIWNYSGAY